MKNNWLGFYTLFVMLIVPFTVERRVYGVWITFADLLIVSALLCELFRYIMGNKMVDNAKFPLLSLITGLLVLFVFSIVKAISPFTATKETLKYFLIYGFFFLCVNNFNDRKILKKLPQVITLSATIITFWFLIDFMKGHVSPITRPWERLWYREFLNYQHLNALGTFLVITIPLGIFEMLQSTSLRQKMIYGAGIFLQIIALFFTYSRGNWIALVIALSIFLLMRYRLRGFLYVALFVVLPFIALSLVFPGLHLKERFFSTVDRNEGSIVARTMYFKAAIDVTKMMPLTGVGAGNYRIAVDKYLHLEVDDMVHNLFLQVAVEAGIIAMLVLMGIIAKYYFDSYSLYVLLADDAYMRTLLLFGVISFTALLVSSQFGDPFVRSIKEYFAVLLALPYAIRNSLLKQAT